MDNKQHLDKAKEFASIYYRLFNTDDGKFVLSQLKKAFKDRKIARQGDDLLTIGIRQGEANVIFAIEEQIKLSGVN